MDSDRIQQFVLLYLAEHKLKYTPKNRIYTIKLNSAHQKWLGTPELKITFDPNLPRSKNLHLIDSTSKILQLLTSNYLSRTVFASLAYPPDRQHLLDANEQALDLPKTGLRCRFEELTITAHYFQLELTCQSSQGTTSRIVSALISSDFAALIDSIDLSGTINAPHPLDFRIPLNLLESRLPALLHDHLSSIEEQHLKKLSELSTITLTNSQDKYQELQRKEDALLSKIEYLKDRSLRASSFDTRRSLDDKIRDLKKKHQELLEKNQLLRDQIRTEFEKEKTHLRSRTIQAQIDILAAAQITMPAISATFSDGDTYIYLPIFHRFVKISPPAN